jgi:hypothetical protein
VSQLISKKLQAVTLSVALLMPAGTAVANDWSKPNSRTKGTVIGAVAGALVGGKKGAVIGAAVGNATQHVRHKHNPHYKRHVAAKHRKHRHVTSR